ncbi:MAG TPA: hypothetical protein VF484_03185, partial [Candidatus Limnocylindrales bacterium]
MDVVTQDLFVAGTFVLVIAFAANVGHAVLLANGRRALGSLLPAPPQPAYAGVASGSFITARTAALSAAPADYAAASPLSTSARWLTILAFTLLVVSMAVRAYIVGRGPWGNLFEFSVAFATSILFGYLVLSRRYSITSIAFIPVGVSLALALYAASLP